MHNIRPAQDKNIFWAFYFVQQFIFPLPLLALELHNEWKQTIIDGMIAWSFVSMNFLPYTPTHTSEADVHRFAFGPIHRRWLVGSNAALSIAVKFARLRKSCVLLDVQKEISWAMLYDLERWHLKFFLFVLLRKKESSRFLGALCVQQHTTQIYDEHGAFHLLSFRFDFVCLLIVKQPERKKKNMLN